MCLLNFLGLVLTELDWVGIFIPDENYLLLLLRAIDIVGRASLDSYIILWLGRITVSTLLILIAREFYILVLIVWYFFMLSLSSSGLSSLWEAILKIFGGTGRAYSLISCFFNRYFFRRVDF